MLNVGEVNLIGEFVEQALAAGLVRNVKSAATISVIFEILRREQGEAQQRQAIEQKVAREKEVREAAEKLKPEKPDVNPPEVPAGVVERIAQRLERGDRE